jgi:hypothetical protein
MLDRLLGPVLVGALILSAVCSFVFSARWFFAQQEVQKLQGLAFNINNILAATQGLANEAIEFGKRNPAIESVLQQIRPTPAAPPGPTAPSPKPGANP